MRWDFMETADLLPDLWTSTVCKKLTSPSTLRLGMYQRKRAVTDIATWVQCLATYTGVMPRPHPQAVPELLAYLIFMLDFRTSACSHGSHMTLLLTPSIHYGELTLTNLLSGYCLHGGSL